MSAWIVSKNHIDVLITAALAWELVVQEQADEKGRMLWEECRISVAYLYPDEKEGEWPGPWNLDESRPGPKGLTRADIQAYAFTPIEGMVDPEVVHYAARSLRYQSCEHPGWATSEAFQLSHQLIEAGWSMIGDHRRRHGDAPRSGFGASEADSPRIFLAAMELRNKGRANARAENQQDVAQLRRAGL